MSGKRDIKNLKEVVDFGFAVTNTGLALYKDGKWHPENLGKALEIIPTVQPAFEDMDEVPAELADLDSNEVAELTSHILAKGVLPAKASQVLDKSLRVAVAAWELVQTIRSE